jgi:hypothetical protein
MDDLDVAAEIPPHGPGAPGASALSVATERPDAERPATRRPGRSPSTASEEAEDDLEGVVVRRDRPPRPRSDLARHATQVRSLAAHLARAYAGHEPSSTLRRPPAVTELLALVERGRMEALATDLDRLWTDALRAHVAAASPMPWPAIAAFHALHALRGSSG